MKQTVKCYGKDSSSRNKFLKSVKGCTMMDKIKNEEVRKELEIFLIQEKIIQNEMAKTS